MTADSNITALAFRLQSKSAYVHKRQENTIKSDRRNLLLLPAYCQRRCSDERIETPSTPQTIEFVTSLLQSNDIEPHEPHP